MDLDRYLAETEQELAKSRQMLAETASLLKNLRESLKQSNEFNEKGRVFVAQAHDEWREPIFPVKS